MLAKVLATIAACRSCPSSGGGGAGGSFALRPTPAGAFAVPGLDIAPQFLFGAVTEVSSDGRCATLLLLVIFESLL